MSEQRPTHPTREPDDYDKGEPRKATRNVPVLVWVVVALLAAWLVVAVVQRGGTHHTPQGGSAPQEKAGEVTMPAAPAGGGAPATPGGEQQAPH